MPEPEPKTALLIIDQQYGSDPAFIERVRQSADRLKELGIEPIWVSIDPERPSRLFRPGGNTSLAEMGFLGHPPGTPEADLQNFTDHFQTNGWQPGEAAFRKQGFDAFANPTNNPFLYYLRERGITQVVLMGSNDVVCVTESAFGAIQNGISSTILSDHVLRDRTMSSSTTTWLADPAASNSPAQYERELGELHDMILNRPHQLVGMPTKEHYVDGEHFAPEEKLAIRDNLRVRTLNDFMTTLPLSSKIEQFVSPEILAELHTQNLANQFYFPDDVVRPFVAASEERRGMKVEPTPRLATPITPLESKQLVIDAYEHYHPELGAKARQLFAAGYNEAVSRNFIEDLTTESLPSGPSRWQVRTSNGIGVMRSIPAGADAEFFDDGKLKNPANTNKHSVIQFDHDGSIDSVIYLGHEVGHSLSDDYLNASGHSYRDWPAHMHETQAYFGQNILRDYLANHLDDSIPRNRELATAARYQAANEMQGLIDRTHNPPRPNYVHERPMSLMTATAIHHHIQTADPETRLRVSETIFGGYGPKDIVAVMTASGLDSEERLREAANRSISQVVNATHDPDILTQPQQQQQRQHSPTEADRARQTQWQAEQQQRQIARRERKDYSILHEAAETARLSRAKPAIIESAHGAAAGLGVIGAVSRLNGQLQEDVKGDAVQATAGVAAMTSDTANAAGGIVSATTQVVERFAPGISEGALGAASRVAGRVALPLAVASAGADVVAGIRSNDAERVAGASGGLAGGIFGGVAAGAAAGALLGVETGPGAIVTGIVGGVVGGIVGEKVAKEYLSDGVRWLMGSKEEKAKPSAGLTSHEVGAGNPSRPNRTTAKVISAAPT